MVGAVEIAESKRRASRCIVTTQEIIPSMKPFMRIVCFTIVVSMLLASPSSPAAGAGKVVLTSVQAGPTPFISFLFLVPDLSAGIKSVQFTIVPKPGSVTRPVSVTYSKSYLQSRGFISGQIPQIMLPVFGLYANYLNTVVLTYSFSNGSTQQQTVLVPTAAFSDPCGFNNPIVIQARTTSKGSQLRLRSVEKWLRRFFAHDYGHGWGNSLGWHRQRLRSSVHSLSELGVFGERTEAVPDGI